MKKENNKTQDLEVSGEKVLKLNFTSGDLTSLDPHELTSGFRGVTLGKCLFEGLTRLNLKGEYELAGAEKVDISPCKTRYTFTLRSNRYSDGTPVVALDYERSWKAALASDSNCLKAHLFYYLKNAEQAKKGEVSLDEVGVKALGDKTLVIKLNHPTPHFLDLVSLTLFAPFKIHDHEILSSGPYMIAKRKKDDYLDLEVNPFFWDCDQTFIKKIKIFMIQNGMTAFSLYEKQEIDWIGDPFSWLSSDIISSEVSKGNFFNETDVILPFWLYLNTEHPPLSSPLIRHALSCVIDRNEIARHVFVGDAPLFTPVPFKQSLSEPVLDSDISKGKELFERGMKELGLTRETFPPLKLSSCSLTNHKRLAEYLQEKWQAAFGIQVDLDIQEWPTFYTNISNGTYQIGGYFMASDYSDPLSCFEILASRANFSKWRNPQYQQIIKKLKREGDPHLRLQLFKESEDILKKEMPIIWILNRVQYHAYRSDLKGLCFDQKGSPDFRWAYFE